ncbi:PREDICTED: DNA ligase 4 [Ceratosolen solmsi marchali]|uniref:DNA ligase 4 n=1 Tax=Ceratosolen solmsi marchali TaxID=326594 RepID=A0AAJ6YPC0_9HYME|nr:PREDICTED: DNA ligase 4 [Ceratosolen solmsi marchali]
MRNRLQNDDCLTIQDINIFLDDVAKYNELNYKKDELFIHIIRKINAIELKWLTRILLKDLKLNLSQKKMFKAMHPDAGEFFNVTSNLQRVCDRYSTLHSEEIDIPIQIEIFSHIKPMLLERLKIEQIGQLFTECQQLYVQIKFDGERSQLHMKNGKYKYFSRQGYDITNNSSYGEYPDSGRFLTSNIALLLNKNIHTIILDGELMGWHKRNKNFGSKGYSYDVKKLTEKSNYQPCFVAYDILIYNDEHLINKVYSERLNYLKSAFTEKEGILMMCKTKTVSNVNEIVDAFNVALDNNDEGIVIKKCNALYKPNVREKSGCFKIKAEYSDQLIQDLDLIILGGYYGEGVHSGQVSSFLVGVANSCINKSKLPSKFFAVVKVASGLSDADLKIIQKKFKPHWMDKKPIGIVGPTSQLPDVWISPRESLIVLLRATEIIKTKVYPLGYSMRFPRILKIRLDKSWFDACSLNEFSTLIKDKKVVQKLTKRKVTTADIDDVIDNEKCNTGKSLVSSLKVYDPFFHAKKEDIVPISRLFEGKKFCVINGDDELSKNDITVLLKRHMAEVLQNPGIDTFCILVGNPETLKAQNIILSNKYDVAKPIWLKRVTRSENLSKIQEFYPWELFASCPATKRKLEDIYDQYFDSYIEDTNEKCLMKSIEKIDEMLEDKSELSLLEMKKLDELMFEGSVSPFSIFRGITGYFYKKDDIEKFSFKFMSGRESKKLNTSIDYVFVADDISVDALQKIKGDLSNIYNNTRKSILIIRTKWICDCFTNRELCSS